MNFISSFSSFSSLQEIHNKHSKSCYCRNLNVYKTIWSNNAQYLADRNESAEEQREDFERRSRGAGNVESYLFVQSSFNPSCNPHGRVVEPLQFITVIIASHTLNKINFLTFFALFLVGRI